MKMMKLKQKLIILLMLPIALILRELLFLYPSFTEKWYARGIYPPIGKLLSGVTGLLSISFAEWLTLTASLAALICFCRWIFKLIRTKDKLTLGVNGFLNLVCVLSVAYCLFLLLWGFNYYRLPLSDSLGYKIERSDVTELKALCADLIKKANEQREEVRQNSQYTAFASIGYDAVGRRADLGYNRLSKDVAFLGGGYGKPKGVQLSYALSYTGIAGLYFPFTGEANVNTLVPYSLLPATLSHEMAHQRGFAREDEANFIAYLSCKAHPDADFRYSGYLLAAIHSMNALYEYDPDSYKELYQLYSPEVRADLKYNSDFWSQFEGPAEELQEKINDRYLKSNKQSDGIYSYGRMVDLLLAERKSKNTP